MGGLLVLAGILSGCANAPDGAITAAEQSARAAVPGLRDTYAQILRAAPSGVTTGAPTRAFVIGSAAGSTMADVTVAVYGHGEGSRAGDPYHQSWALLCVRLSGRAGPRPEVTSTEITCPASPPPPGAPTAVDVTVEPSSA
jgi:hypothetical protein